MNFTAIWLFLGMDPKILVGQDSSGAANLSSTAVTNPVDGVGSGNGTSTRGWDCCKPSCAWAGKAPVTSAVRSCSKDGVTTLSNSTTSICNGGTAHACNDNAPFVVNGSDGSSIAYGFAAAVIVGQSEYQSCCSCYELTFASGPVLGKKMVVQVTNTGADLGKNQFVLQIPGGGVGYFNAGCQSQWEAPADGWGARYGGVSAGEDCAKLPTQLQAGCNFRFDWLQGADNPNVSFKSVTCPTELTDKSGCIRVA